MKYSKKLIIQCKTIINKRFKLSNDILELLHEETSFLPNNISNRNRLYYVINDITEQVKCLNCNNLSDLKYINSEYSIKCCSFSCTVKLINPKTGLTKAQEIGQKTQQTNSKVNPKTGKSIYQENAKKSAKTMSIIDNNGVSIYDKSAIKISNTVTKISNNTCISQERIKKIKNTLNNTPNHVKVGRSKRRIKTLNKINPKTGLTKAQEIGQKTQQTNSKVNPKTGKSIYQENAKKYSITRKIKTFHKIFKYFPVDYKLLTTENEFIYSKDLAIKYECLKCKNEIFSSRLSIRCTKCFPYNKSIAENEILEYCQSLSYNIESNSRSIIKPLELDIYLPKHNLAIEYNGLFWHSSYSLDSENKNYHLNKTELCQEQGIQLFHIFENEWLDPIKQNIWKSIIKNRLGQSSRIYARKTRVNPVSSKDKTQFLIDNHLQGDCVSSVNIGLYIDDELVSLMTFGRSRYDKKIDWELIRFCNKIDYSVIGGASKLLADFRREHVGSIVSYADKRRSIGNLYKALGFELSHDSKPNYWYFKNWKNDGLESRIKYQKHKLENTLDVFDINKTESENMYENGYRKIYDCGNQVWINKENVDGMY